jgi:hypothetical protein
MYIKARFCKILAFILFFSNKNSKLERKWVENIWDECGVFDDMGDDGDVKNL